MFRLEDWLRQGLAEILGLTLPKPATPRLVRVEQLTMFRHHIATPPEPAVPDFAKRVATINIIAVDGTAKPEMTTDIAKGKTEFQVDAELDEKVHIVLRDYDIRQNGSDPSDPFDFTVVDTVPPPKPGVMHIASVEQIDDGGVVIPPVVPPVVPPAVPLAMAPSPLSGNAPLSVALNVTGDAALTAVFNSGETDAVDLPAPPPTSVIYNTPGTFNATVKAGTETATATITVSQAPVTASPTGGTAPGAK